MADEPTPVIELLKRFVGRGDEFLSRKEDLRAGALQVWGSSVRSHLAKIYGKDAPSLLQAFPRTPEAMSAVEVRAKFVQQTALLKEVISRLERLTASNVSIGERIFIGHGRSHQWLLLKDFLQDRLHLPWEEFNREPVAGYTTFERIEEMLSRARFAFLVMTGEDERPDGSLHARENVIHEAGLFQGKLGPKRAIILLEEGCEEFSNIVGLAQIRFPRGNIAAKFEEIRLVLEQRGVIRN
jgi:predicted nucleotide-binding protein